MGEIGDMSGAQIRKRHARVCKWKVKLATGPEAEAYLLAAMQNPRVPRKESLNLYTCAECGCKHLGHRPKWKQPTPFGARR